MLAIYVGVWYNAYMRYIVSLGAGVQSSTLCLMAAKGELEHMPEAAIFADTQGEPASVYRWLDWLEGQLPFPVYRVTQGDLAAAATTVRTSKKTGNKYIQTSIPAFTRAEEGKRGGIMMRHCTVDYKIKVIQRAARRICGVKRRNKAYTEQVCMYIGISTDEASRMKESRVEWITNEYPLIDIGMSRIDCIKWMNEHGYPTPPRSACVFCPYHSDAEWDRMKREEPEEFRRAVEFERRFFVAQRETPLRGVAYLHESRVPLDEVKFNPEKGKLKFNNECLGMCGV